MLRLLHETCEQTSCHRQRAILPTHSTSTNKTLDTGVAAHGGNRAPQSHAHTTFRKGIPLSRARNSSTCMHSYLQAAIVSCNCKQTLGATHNPILTYKLTHMNHGQMRFTTTEVTSRLRIYREIHSRNGREETRTVPTLQPKCHVDSYESCHSLLRKHQQKTQAMLPRNKCCNAWRRLTASASPQQDTRLATQESSKSNCKHYFISTTLLAYCKSRKRSN